MRRLRLDVTWSVIYAKDGSIGSPTSAECLREPSRHDQRLQSAASRSSRADLKWLNRRFKIVVFGPSRQFPNSHPHLLPLPDNAQNRTTKLGPQGRIDCLPQGSFPLSLSLYCTSKPFFTPTELRAFGAYICYRQAWFVFSSSPVRRTNNFICCFPGASEVSSILESRISGTSVGGNVEETGRVLSALVSMH